MSDRSSIYIFGVEYREAFRWTTDNMPGTTPAIVYASMDGDVVIGEYRHWNHRNCSTQTRKLKNLKKSKRGNYLRVCINNRSESVHRLVCKAWHGEPADGMQVNHKNGVKTDNRASNLEWVTASENQIHISRDLGIRCGEKHHNSKYTKDQVTQVTKMLSAGIRSCEIAMALGVKKYFVSDIKNGRARRYD